MNPFCRKIVFTILLALPVSLLAENTNTPLPSLKLIIQRVIQQAKNETDNERRFDERYGYTRTKITVFRNSAGQVKKREEKTDVHSPIAPAPAPAVVIQTNSAPEKTEAISDTHSNVHGQQLKKSDFLLNEDLLNRFVFTLVGRELLDGRPMLILDFVPANKKLPERNLKDRFINQAAGRVWIDEGDYSVAKAILHLTRRVNVGFGLVGAVWKFDYGFEREQTPDGLWFTHKVDWHLEGREVIIDRTVDYHETVTNLHRLE